MALAAPQRSGGVFLTAIELSGAKREAHRQAEEESPDIEHPFGMHERHDEKHRDTA